LHFRDGLKSRGLLFTSKKFPSIKEENFRDRFKKASESVCTLTRALSPHSVSTTPSTSSATKVSENNTEKDSDEPEPAEGSDIQTEYTSNYLYSLCIGQIQNYL
jgi:hypothetical protein